ncbi:hypothetical protein JXA05_00480 [Candidatus Peregrinibacteria bacterium]|nr:hypothetical protein [Candidatus Peregrinibacteria bacterium]
MKRLTFFFIFLSLSLATAAMAGEPTPAQLAELDKLGAACKANSTTLEACLDALRLATAKPEAAAAPAPMATYTVDVRCRFTAEELKREFDWVNDNITPEHFPIPSGCRDGKAEVAVFHFNRPISSDGAVSEMDKAGYRPATLPELRALAKAQPELQRESAIIALGSRWRDPGGDLNVPFLYERDGERSLYLYWFAYDWDGYYRFLAVRK